VAHDGDTVAQVVGLVHEVGGQQDHSVVFVVLQHFPNVSAGTRVHSTRRFIQHNELAVPDECDPYTQPPLLST